MDPWGGVRADYLRPAEAPRPLHEGISRTSILTCGTSWHAGLVAKYLIERLAQDPRRGRGRVRLRVRYRHPTAPSSPSVA